MSNKNTKTVATQTITRKIQLIPVGDKEEINRVYNYLRDGMYNQNKAYNILISSIYAAIYSGKSNEEINEIYKKGQRCPKENDPDYSLYKFGEITFPKGMMTQSTVKMKVKADIKTAKSNGLFKGKVSLQNKKLDAPLWIESQQFSFYHNYKNYQEFLDHLQSTDLEVFMKFVNGIHFRVIFGNPHKSNKLRCVIKNIFEENYRVQGSSIQIDGKKIILNLAMAIPKQKHQLDENTVVGVKLGLTVPAVCALNNNEYAREFIGSMDDFLRIRTKIQAQRRRLQKSLTYTSGGHGRKKKLKHLEIFKKYESNFVQTYNHMVSKRIVEFALKHNAKYINLMNLRGYDEDKFVLRNWSYYQLQQYIIYKASLHGIEVRYINQCYTSQVCSYCGHWEEEQCIGQSSFVCGNENCKSNVKNNQSINVDYNAARNIAKSTLFMDGKTAISKEDMKAAREYYGIPEKEEVAFSE